MACIPDGNVVKKMATRWHDKFAAAHRMISMDWNNLGQLCDTFERADETDQGGVDIREFSKAFREIYPPWRTAVDSNVATNVLNKLFTKARKNSRHSIFLSRCDASHLITLYLHLAKLK